MEKNSVKPQNIFQIFLKGLMIYLTGILPFSRVMLFPVFGQVLGIILILGPVYFYRVNFIEKLPVEQLQENIIFIFLGLILIVIPGFIIFLKAFWEYMIAMVSLNTMAAGILEKSGMGNFKAHNNAVKARSKDYIILLFILMGVWLILMLVPFIVLALGFGFLNKVFSMMLFGLSIVVCSIILAVISVYLCLSFQVFAFEHISPVGVIKKSFSMIDKNFWRAVVLGVILSVLTGGIAPYALQLLVKNSPALGYLAAPFDSYLAILADNPIVATVIDKLEPYIPDIAGELALSTAGTLLTAFVLPLGSTCFTLLYLDINNKGQSGATSG